MKAVLVTGRGAGAAGIVDAGAPSSEVPRPAAEAVEVDEASEARARERRRRATLTSLSSLAPKLLSLAILLIGARFAAGELSQDGFGVWLLLVTASGLLGFADLGLGNGLLNEVATAYGRDDLSTMRRAIASASAALALVAALLVAGFLLASQFVSWSELLDVQGPAAGSVGAAIGVFVVATAVSVGFGAAQRVRLAVQTGWVNNAWGTAGGVFSLVAVVVAALLGGSLPVLVAAAMIGPPVVAIADTVLLFGVQRPELRPSWASIHRVDAMRLIRQGSMFFFLAVAIAVGYESDALVISHALGAGAVPQFALPYRIVMLAPAAVSLVTVALWPAYSESMARGDSAWAERTLKRSLVYAAGGTAFTSAAVVIVGPIAWSWLEGTATVPSRGLLLVLGLLACVMSVSTAFGVFLSATGRLRIQVVAAAVMTVSNVMLSLALVGPLGVVGPAWGTIVSQTLFVLLPVGFVVGRSLRKTHGERARATM